MTMQCAFITRTIARPDVGDAAAYPQLAGGAGRDAISGFLTTLPTGPIYTPFTPPFPAVARR